MSAAIASGMRAARTFWPGCMLAVVIALAATFVAESHRGPQLLYALFIGIAFNFLAGDAATRPGIDLCARGVLRLGVGLLGARITAAQIAGLGWATAAIVVVAVATTIAGAVWLARRMGMTHAQGALSGGAVAICGASAALAISAVLPRDRDSERFTLMVVVCVTVMSTVAMVAYPALVQALDLSPPLAGLFLGGSIHDVAQVVGAAFTLGRETGDVATIVKLFRVALLALVVLVVSLAFRAQRQRAAEQPGPDAGPSLVPWFLWVFVALVAANSLGAVPAQVAAGLGEVSRACLVVAIAALGVKTSFAELAQAGWRPLLLLLAETAWIAAVVLAGVMLVR